MTTKVEMNTPEVIKHMLKSSRFSKEEITDLIRDSLQRIEKKENWTQKALARRKDGTQCLPTSKEAYSFCAVGSLEASPLDYEQEWTTNWDNREIHIKRTLADTAEQILLAVVDSLPWEHAGHNLRKLNYFNDDNASHQDVKTVFEIGIKLLEEYKE